MDLPENKLSEFMDNDEKPKWRTVNNHNICEFTEDNIKRITQNYTRPIGEGAFGQVYKGVFDDGSLVAVKKYINQNFKQGFAKEVTVHCQINHKNVVRLLGYCADENSLTMVTEFMYNGNLSDLLHCCGDQIDLEERLCIAIDCAEALSYMHCSMYQAIIHGDIKPANILLDDKLSAKLSDFGISRLLTMDKTQYTMNVIGSRGYADPEFIVKGRIDLKNDVYSFGVVLLELITRRKACEDGIISDLTESFVNAVKLGKMPRSMFDAEIASVSNLKILDKMGELAAACLSSDMKKRPQMKHVSEFLYKLREKYHCQGQEKIGKWPSWGIEKINQDSAITSSSNSTLVYKTASFDIFKRNARSNFNRNGGLILETISGIRILTREELRPILTPSNIIGRGRFGPVYRGLLGGQLVVARQSISFDQKEQFLNEVIAQSKIIHKNIVKLIGCCLEVDVPIMIYEFVSKGSVSDILHGRRKKPVNFGVRLKIAAGSAEGLSYILGTSTSQHLIFKPANVLLDDNFEPKISGFGFGLTDYDVSDMDYMDPGYPLTGTLLTDKTAAYSFGVFLLELICRKKAKHSDNESLVKNLFDAKQKDGRAGSAFFDMEIAIPRNMELLEDLATLAWACLNPNEEKKGKMASVAACLQTLKRSHEYRMHDYRMPYFDEDSE
ncbi:unnamed protein product [Urochloa humidicola]